MKATLTFTLPDDESDFRTAVDARKWWCLAWDFAEWIRRHEKYVELDEDYGSPSEYHAALRGAWYELMDVHGLTFDE